MKWWSKSILVLNVIAIIATLLAYLTPHIDPQKIWIFAFLGLMYPILLLANLGFIVFWAFYDMRFALLSIFTIGAGWNHISSYFAYNTDKISNNPHDISIISFNIGNAIEAYDKRTAQKEDKQSRMNDFLERFKDEDIICLQEVGAYASDIINKNFKKYNIHKFDKGAVILSRHKMIKKGHIEFGTKTNSCLWADIIVGMDTVRVYSLHLQSNKITKDANDVIDHGNLKEEKTWEGIFGIFKKYRYYHKTRSMQAKIVKEHANISPYPVLICGDFNDVPLSFTYDHLSKNLLDAFKTKGAGIGSTFNGRIPFLRIDYILADPALKINKFNVIRENFSDHYPIAALLTLRQV